MERVVDGDTIRLDGGGTVRLVQIDAPELDECYAAESTRALRRLLPPGTAVLIGRDDSLDDRDDYGRLLRYVLLAGGAMINVDLVRDGNAAPYFFRNDRGAFASELVDAAESARSARRGLWGACPRARLEPGRGALTGPA